MNVEFDKRSLWWTGIGIILAHALQYFTFTAAISGDELMKWIFLRGLFIFLPILLIDKKVKWPFFILFFAYGIAVFFNLSQIANVNENGQVSFIYSLVPVEDYYVGLAINSLALAAFLIQYFLHRRR